MPSLKALNSSAESRYKATNTANLSSPPSRSSEFSIKTGAESGAGNGLAQTPCPRWKLYDNPFFVAAVASAVVEATLNQEQHQEQDGADHEEEPVVIPGCEIQEEEAQQEQASCSQQPLQDHDKKKKERRPSSTPRARQSFRRASPVQQSVEVRRKPIVAEDEKLRTELLKAWTSIQALDKAEREAKAKAERLSRRLEDGKVVWEAEVQDKLTSSLQAMKHRLKEEKGSNKCLGLANQKLEQELAETRKAISEARRNAVGERQAKRMIEDVCDELAKEIGDDRAQVMELRRQSSATRKEAEDTRKTLQMGEVWREEKVQTRLVEARFAIEHKSMELDKLISQVEAFLEARNVDLHPFHPEIITQDKESVELDTVQDKQEVSEDRKAHKDHTRLLLNGSGFHMRMKKVQNGGSGRGNAAAAAAAGNGGKPVVQRIWPTSIRVDKKSLVSRGHSIQAVE